MNLKLTVEDTVDVGQRSNQLNSPRMYFCSQQCTTGAKCLYTNIYIVKEASVEHWIHFLMTDDIWKSLGD